MNTGTSRSHRRGIPRYRLGARFYDTLSAERLVYRTGREKALTLLELQPGARVLIVGCGTGLDLPLVLDAIGPTGEIVAVDQSTAMLRQAAKKARRGGWDNVTLIHGDAADLAGVDGTFDAVMFTYSLSVIPDWRVAWDTALTRLVPGGKVSIVDTDLPTGRGRALTPLAAFALFTGKVDRRRQVWQLVTQHADEYAYQRLSHGHIHVAVGAIDSVPCAPATQDALR